jgi:hypothetical protein
MNVNEVREGDYAAALALIEQADQNCCGGELGSENLELFEEKVEEEVAVQVDTTTDTVTTTTITDNPPTPEPEEDTEENAEEQEEETEEKEKKPNAITGIFKKMGKFIGGLVNDD